MLLRHIYKITVLGRVALFLLLFIDLGKGAAMSASDQPVFRYRFVPGMSLQYQVTVKGSVTVDTPVGSQTNPLHIEMIILQDILEVEGAKARIRVKILGARVIEGNQSAPLPEEGETSIMLMDERGQLEVVSGAGAFQGSEFAQMQFPEKPLQIGEFWVQDANSKVGTPVKSATLYTFSGLAKTRDGQVAQFDAEMGMSPDGKQSADPNAISKGMTFFHLELGQVIRTIAETEFSFRMPIPDDPSQIIVSRTRLHTEMKLITPIAHLLKTVKEH